LSTATSARYFVRSSVVSAAETASTVDFTSPLTLALVRTGVTFCARKRFFVSSSTLRLSVWIAESVEKMFATWIWFFFSAALVSGPPGSRDLKDLKVRP
jgi:hypothetical protein